MCQEEGFMVEIIYKLQKSVCYVKSYILNL